VVASKRLPVAMVRALFAVLLVTQALMIADACAYAMPGCTQPCPSAACRGVAPNLCGASHARPAQAPAADALGIPAFHAHAVAVPPSERVVVRDVSRARWRSPITAALPTYIVFGRMRD
jgi:hypothetical protein